MELAGQDATERLHGASAAAAFHGPAQLSNGESGPPCGVPSSVAMTTPSDMTTPARNIVPMMWTIRSSRIVLLSFASSL